MTIFGSFFRPSTVDGIMAGFQRTIDQLRELAQAKTDENGQLREQMNRLNGRYDDNLEEAMKANLIRSQLEKIINPAKPDNAVPF
jgi:hypothetical protein